MEISMSERTKSGKEGKVKVEKSISNYPLTAQKFRKKKLKLI